MQILADEIRKDIDDSMLADMQKDSYRKLGWSEIKLTNIRKKLDEGMDNWIRINCIGKWAGGLKMKAYFFEIEKDATLFSLRWA